MANSTTTLNHGHPTSLDGLIHRISIENPKWLRHALWLRCAQIQRNKRQCTKQGIARHQWFTAPNSPYPAPLRVLILPEIPPCHSSDRLSVLPHDIRMEILSFLFLPAIERIGESAPNPFDRGSFRQIHVYSQLALVNRIWRDQVEAFCSHQLLVLKQAHYHCAGRPLGTMETLTNVHLLRSHGARRAAAGVLRFLWQEVPSHCTILARSQVLP